MMMMPSMDARAQTAMETLTNRLALRVFRGFRWRDCDDYRTAGLGSSFSRLVVVERSPRPDGGVLTQRDPHRRVPLHAGQAYLIPAGVRFDLFYRRGVVLYSTFLRLDGPGGEDLLGSVGTIRAIALSSADLRLISSLAEHRRTVADALRFRATLMATIVPLLDLDLTTLAERATLAERHGDLLAEIERLPPARVSVRLLARRLGQRPDTMAKRFRRDLGQPLKAFLLDRLRQRIAEALDSDEPVAVVATRLGFADPFYFSRCCRRLLGVSPRTYRERLALPGAREA